MTCGIGWGYKSCACPVRVNPNRASPNYFYDMSMKSCAHYLEIIKMNLTSGTSRQSAARRLSLPGEAFEKPHLIVKNFKLSPSAIHGTGLFALSCYPADSEMEIAMVIDSMSYIYAPYLGGNYDKTADTGYAKLSAIR